MIWESNLSEHPNQDDQDLGDEPVIVDRDVGVDRGVGGSHDLPKGPESGLQEDSPVEPDSVVGSPGSECPGDEGRPRKSRSGRTIRTPTWLEDYEVALEDLFVEEEVGSSDSPVECPEREKGDGCTGEVLCLIRQGLQRHGQDGPAGPLHGWESLIGVNISQLT